jgi:heme exporter protein CcmD
MTHAAYVYSGYAITAAVLAAYAGWVLARARALRPPSRDDSRP